ncbi:BZ3500_MvSof-1268-A1-R1_Chr2-1g04229 [Microbotryum saponariae]|uniref:BZ3500_MvSof-1268-A1-R1_Chr2-1g04229 protein n=1 Tax=Microbotryum saponariae TaxID=289078 RepID=A0A2X0KJN4_9BASI|nr:BZ3500_MvSof-1268-A1-R1_Chr2-1g04229 [Microbotryum saponariae]SCZ91216.1 BZ3501_MvSof-1269-A2-R1_Chr2-1g03885 [Microbotryum saponariae]
MVRIDFFVALSQPTFVVSRSTLGWVYTFAWSASFYPQFLLNLKRRSIQGLSVDFLVLNPLGFASYATYNIVLFSSKTVRDQYRQRHDGHKPLIRPNDVAFAVHALVISSATLLQAIIYRKTTTQTISTYNQTFIGLALSSILVVALLAATTTSSVAWLDLLYFLSYIKLYISTAKYIPQAYLNYKSKSTVGWSIENILLDCTGGVLSLTQLVLDSWLDSDWRAITGNPGKLYVSLQSLSSRSRGLSFLSIGFDILFLLQHYVWYRHSSQSLLEASSSDTNGIDDPDREDPIPNSAGGGSTERSRLLA